MKEELKELRENLLNKINKNSMIILEGAKEIIRNNDVNYYFRQKSSFFYLTHCIEPNCKLVILKKENHSEIYLFKEEQSEIDKVWNNPKLSYEEHKEMGNYTEVFSNILFKEFINKNILKYSNIYIDFSNIDLCNLIYVLDKNKSMNLINVNGILNEQRLIKTPKEIQNIEIAISITKKAFDRVCEELLENTNESHIEADIDYIFKRNKVLHAYPSIVASGDNGNILHYSNNNKEFDKNDLVLMDFGCEYNCYASDVSRTIPLFGKFSKPQKKIYNMVLDIQKKIISSIRPGTNLENLNNMYNGLIVENLIKLGILQGTPEEELKSKDFRKYSPHSIGHWLGLDVHDTCPYTDKEGDSIIFKEGMVMTIEPGLYFQKEDKTIPEEYRGIAIRIEDNVLVTKNSYEVLTKEIENKIRKKNNK